MAVGVRLPLWQHVALTVACRAVGNARLVTIQADRGTSTSVNVGFAATTGDRTVLVLGSVEPDRGAVERLTEAFDDADVAVAQPLLIGEDDVIESAGAVFGRSTARPEAFLKRHPTSDAVRAGCRPVPAALASIVAVRSDVLAALGGLEPLLSEHLAETDLSLRAHAAGLGHTRLCTTAWFVTRTPMMPLGPDRLASSLRVFDERFSSPPPDPRTRGGLPDSRSSAVHLDLVGDSAPGPLDTPMLAPRTAVRPVRAVAITEAAPTLRWTIDLAARSGRRAAAGATSTTERHWPRPCGGAASTSASTPARPGTVRPAS